MAGISLVTRRRSIKMLSAALLGSALPSRADAQQNYRFGYAAITWAGNDRQAITEIAAVGFRGIQLRTDAVRQFGRRPGELKELLARHRLVFVALSSGTIGIEPAGADEELALHLKHARFLRDAGGMYLQVVDARPARTVAAADYVALGRRLTELGKRTADLGIPLGYHHHIGSLGEAPDEVDQILEASDPSYVKLILDTAHYLQGGGDPGSAIERYASRLLFLHLKDVRPRMPGPGEKEHSRYQFVELGEGRLDFMAIFRALAAARFRGWIVVELDAVPDRVRTPKACAERNRDYITRELGLTL